jgi:hypothetical protein
MKLYTHIRMIRNTDMDEFIDEVTKRSEELQNRDFQLEYDYKPVFYKGVFRKKIIYTCMIKAYRD